MPSFPLGGGVSSGSGVAGQHFFCQVEVGSVGTQVEDAQQPLLGSFPHKWRRSVVLYPGCCSLPASDVVAVAASAAVDRQVLSKELGSSFWASTARGRWLSGMGSQVSSRSEKPAANGGWPARAWGYENHPVPPHRDREPDHKGGSRNWLTAMSSGMRASLKPSSFPLVEGRGHRAVATSMAAA